MTGPNFAKAAQYEATDRSRYEISPHPKTAYKTLPPPNTDSAPEKASDKDGPPFATLGEAKARTVALKPEDLPLLLTGATGLPAGSVDTRIRNVTALPNCPFQLPPGVRYDDYAA